MAANALNPKLVEHFRYLCNTDSVNKQLGPQDIEDIKQMIKGIKTPMNVNSDPMTNNPSSMPSFSSKFKQLSPVIEPKTMEEDPNADKPFNEEAEQEGEPEEGELGSEGEEEPEDGEDLGSEESERRPRPETFEERNQKRNKLHELQSMGVQTYCTMESTLFEIDDEIKKIQDIRKRTSFVTQWKGYVETGASVCEIGSMFLPKQVLHLQGLQERIQQVHKSGQVDLDWERIYIMYNRKRESNPILAVAIAYVVAIVVVHFLNWAEKKGKGIGAGGGGSGLAAFAPMIMNMFKSQQEPEAQPTPAPPMPSQGASIPTVNQNERAPAPFRRRR